MPRYTEVEIVPYRDGPYLVRGPVVIRDQDGAPVPLSRHPVALCRCGKSRLRPFCDGTHQLIGFSAPSEPERPSPEHETAVVAGPGEESLRDAARALPGSDAAAAEVRHCIRGALHLLEDHNAVAARSLVGAALDALEANAGNQEAVAALRAAAREIEAVQ